MAAGLGDVLAALQVYLAASEAEERTRAVADADAALHLAILGGEPEHTAGEVAFDADAALKHALTLRARIDERLQGMAGTEAEQLRVDLEELFDLIARYVSESAARD
jgi:hypothetical protein